MFIVAYDNLQNIYSDWKMYLIFSFGFPFIVHIVAKRYESIFYLYLRRFIAGLIYSNSM